jgi:hypothetical protein
MAANDPSIPIAEVSTCAPEPYSPAAGRRSSHIGFSHYEGLPGRLVVKVGRDAQKREVV